MEPRAGAHVNLAIKLRADVDASRKMIDVNRHPGVIEQFKITLLVTDQRDMPGT